MNDKYIIASKACENVVEDGKTTGYELRLRIPYYQGVPMSQIKFIRLWMDCQEIPQEDICVFAVSGEMFKLSEIITVSLFYWEYMTPLRVRVCREGGLAKGAHRLDVKASIDVIYAPDGFVAEACQQFEV
ncbi:MAG: hypothetical protein K2P04_00545 [Oscillospiraceae bacterium]|nr:hypothetical protein [Oscillospiraceae bacterium]